MWRECDLLGEQAVAGSAVATLLLVIGTDKWWRRKSRLCVKSVICLPQIVGNQVVVVRSEGSRVSL